MPQRVKVVQVLALIAGIAAGVAIALRWRNPTAPLSMVWAGLAIAGTTAAGLICGYGLGRWYELKKLCTVSVRQVFWWVIALVGGSLLVMIFGPDVIGSPHGKASGGPGTGQGGALVSMFAIVAAVPIAAVMLGMWRAVASDAPLGPKDAPACTKGDQVKKLLALRSLLQRMLAAVGSVVVLTTFTAGTWWLVERSLHTQFGSRPPQFVIIFGAFGSTLVALVYGPPWSALQRRGRQLCDRMFPLRDVDETAVIVSRVADRQTLEQSLGLNRGFLADFQSGVVILAPLLVGAVAAFLPH